VLASKCVCVCVCEQASNCVCVCLTSSESYNTAVITNHTDRLLKLVSYYTEGCINICMNRQEEI